MFHTPVQPPGELDAFGVHTGDMGGMALLNDHTAALELAGGRSHAYVMGDGVKKGVGVSSAPLSTSSTSSCASDNDDAMDMDDAEDAALAAATSALLADEHTELDAEMLREMEELLATSREDTTQWNQFHLDSPSLMFPAPPPSWSEAIAGSDGQQASTQTMNGFLPRGEGWHVEKADENDDEMEDNMEDDGDEDAKAEDAEPTRPDAEVREIELLVRQLKFLEAQREFLEYKADLASASDAQTSSAEVLSRQRATEEKKRLVEAQLHKEMLAKVAKSQLENLKYMELLLLQSPLNHYRMTLMTPMESYIHLTRDPAERRGTLLALRDEKIDNVRRFIEFQSRNIDLERQFFYLDTFEKFGKFYTVDFSISKLDDTTVDEVVNIIYNHFVSTNDTISQILGSVENREYFDGIEWAFLNARFVDRINLPKRQRHDKGFVVQESNTVYYVKKFGQTAVMMCDYIDKDDLHPYRPTGRIRKDKTVGVIVEPYVDSQGKPSVVMKRFSFIKHHFKNIPPTPDLVQAISTKVILWGQAVRFCIAGRTKAQRRPVVPAQLATRAQRITELASTVR